MQTGTLKTSTIFVSVGQRTRVYRSVDDMPAPLRHKLEKTTGGSNSATILIADRKGKEELVRAIQGLPSSIPLRVTQEARRKKEHRAKMHRASGRRHWLEIFLLGILGFLLWSLSVWEVI
jgi:hypothetical protein